MPERECYYFPGVIMGITILSHTIKGGGPVLRVFANNFSFPARAIILAFIALALASSTVGAAEGGGEMPSHWGRTFLMFAIVLVAGKMGSIVERFNQPSVIGELMAGILLAVVGYMGADIIPEIVNSTSIAFLSHLGALLLLFSIGLESNLTDMKNVGVNALLVALIGVAVPFALGTLVMGPIFFGSESFHSHLFLGAALVATSVGITASVFQSLGILRTRAAQTVLGAAVIDDVIGLIVLAVVSALASGGTVTAGMVFEMIAKSFVFLAGAVLLGRLLAPHISRFFSIISRGVGMKLGIALGLALLFGYLAEIFGLEPIIGAFAAGLILDSVTFRYYADPAMVGELATLKWSSEADDIQAQKLIRKHRESHVDDLFHNLNYIFVPVFFVYTGMQIDIESLLKPELYLAAIVISIAAILGKLVAGIAAKGDMLEKLMVGASMVPRGEVGLIFAATGKAVGVLNQDEFSVVIMVVILTTFVSPPIIGKLGKQLMARQQAAAEVPAT